MRCVMSSRKGSSWSLRMDPIDFVDHQEQRLLQAAHPLPHPDVLIGEAHGLDHEQDDIGVLGGGNRDAIHVLIHHAARRLVQPRRIDQHQLRLRPIDHPQDPVPGGLRLGGDDGDLAAHQRVHQRRFADVGPADDGHHARREMRGCRVTVAVPGCAFRRAAAPAVCAAANCSARRRLPPSPTATRPKAGTSQVTREGLRVRIARHRRQGVDRQRQSARLQRFLQARLRILQGFGRRQIRQCAAP